MVAILPTEVLQLALQQCTCRELQVRTLATLYNNVFATPPILVAYGLDSTGKVEVISAVLEARHLLHTIIKCRECLSQRHLLGKIFSACAQALDREEAIEQYERVDSINALAANLQRLFEGTDQKLVLVLDSIDDLKGAGSTLLPALSRLGDMIPTLSIILTTTSPRPLPLHRSGVPHIPFPPYTRSEAIHLATLHPPSLPPHLSSRLNADDIPRIYKQFAITVYDALIAPTTTSLTTFSQALTRLWPRFLWPALSGESPSGRGQKWDFSRLLVRNRSLFHAAGEAALLDSLTPSNEAWTFEELEAQLRSSSSITTTTVSNPSKTALTQPPPAPTSTLLLQPLPTLLLLAAHLCSHTPPKHDILLFSRLSNAGSKHRKIRYIKRGNPSSSSTPKKAHEDGRRKDRTKSLAPKAFGMERLCAVGRAVAVDVVGQGREAEGWSDRVARGMGELERLRLVRREGDGEGDGGEGRWRVDVGREVVEELVGRRGLGVREWELDL